jgi:hypothetical protein
MGCINNINAKLIDAMGPTIVNEVLKSLHDLEMGPLGGHYEKSCLSKSHYPSTKIQKTNHIQLLCNYPLGVTTIVQLSF